MDKLSLRIFLEVVAQEGWFLEQSDIKTAFLSADNEGTDYVRLPGCVVQRGESPVRLLKKALYGLRRAPRAWNSTFTEWVVSVGFRASESEPCLFLHKEKQAMLVIYVNDLLVAAATMEEMSQVQGMLEARFKTRSFGEPTYFLGMNVAYDRKGKTLHLSQQTYVDALMEKYGEFVSIRRSLPIVGGVQLTKEQGELEPTTKPYSSLVGALLFLSVSTHPDICFAVNVLTKFLKCPGKAHWDVAIGVLLYLGGTRELGIQLGGVRVGGEKGCLG